jgi:hypothetical protein
MKRYKLLKDLPCAEAGEIFQQGYDENDKDNVYLFQGALGVKYIKIWLDYIDDFNEWFEEIKEYYVINSVFGEILKTNDNSHSDLQIRTMRDLGMLFDTWLEADKKLAYLKAKAIIKQDTKGFKPNWQNINETKYLGFWDLDEDKLDYLPRNIFKEMAIYFKSREDIEESFEKHPEEWKTYLFYEQ